MKIAFLSDPVFQRHSSPGHVERPERLQAVLEALARVELPLVPLATREATDEELLSCHDPSVLKIVAALTLAGGGQIDFDTYVNEDSDRAARLAVGGGIDLAHAVLEGTYDRGFSAARPPGHHATPTRSMGFCLYSTVAIVARSLAALGKRVLILDWDVHHGNGTQDCLYDDGGVCFVSIHQSAFYPGSGYPDEGGSGDGAGLTYNIALPAGCGDEEYLYAYDRIVNPVILDYDPHIILVSAGYDAHHLDLLGGMKVTVDGFRQLAARVARDSQATSAQGRLVGFLEGGYHLGGLTESVVATLEEWSTKEHALIRASRSVDGSAQYLIDEMAREFELNADRSGEEKG